MNKEKLEMLNEYLKNTNMPILVEDVPSDLFSEYITLPSNVSVGQLVGHFENTKFLPPSWFTELVKKCEENKGILVITDINKINKYDQGKFVEILKYRQVSTFKLPEEVHIILTASNLKEKEMNEEVYSLLVHI